MEVAHIIENKDTSKIYGLMGNIDLTTNYANYGIITDYRFNGTVGEYLNSSKAKDALKMVLLDESYLDKKYISCSISELKRISLAKAFIMGKDYIVLNYFLKELNYQEKTYFYRLFKRLAYDYHKTVIIFTNDITEFWNIADEFIIVDKYKVINTISKDKYFDFIHEVNTPNIIRFIDLIKNKNISISYYKEESELLKAIYRIKESS